MGQTIPLGAREGRTMIDSLGVVVASSEESAFFFQAAGRASPLTHSRVLSPNTSDSVWLRAAVGRMGTVMSALLVGRVSLALVEKTTAELMWQVVRAAVVMVQALIALNL
jgi:hypothetical protein